MKLDAAQAGKASTKLAFAATIGSGTASGGGAVAAPVAAPVADEADDEETACERKVRKTRAERRAALVERRALAASYSA